MKPEERAKELSEVLWDRPSMIAVSLISRSIREAEAAARADERETIAIKASKRANAYRKGAESIEITVDEVVLLENCADALEVFSTDIRARTEQQEAAE